MINEFIWVDDDNDSSPSADRNNVIMDRDHPTLIRANRHIKASEELFMAYDADYDWDDFKFDHIANLVSIITKIWNLYEEGGVEIPKPWRHDLQSISTILPLLSTRKKSAMSSIRSLIPNESTDLIWKIIDNYYPAQRSPPPCL
jgi:hypothetical protein